MKTEAVFDVTLGWRSQYCGVLSLEKDGVTPVTVKDGREYLQRYNNTVKKAEVPTYTHDKQRAVTLKGVYFRYAKDLPDIMRGVSFEVYNNEHFCILGGNGAGKSTALSVIAGINKAYRGKVTLDTKRVAMLPQNVESVFVQKSVCLDLKEVADSERVDKMLKRLGITHLKDKHPYDLSGGEMQKCALAKVLLNEPSLLLLDEPTKAIDAHSKNTLADIISMLKNDGVTVITVTHDVEFAAKTADRLGIFFDGELLSSDTPVSFFSGNSFYTTAASRISSGQFENAVLCEQVVSLCRQNGKKGGCVCP